MTVGILAIMLNEAEHVKHWLNSVISFADLFDDLVVVDGGSQDTTVDYLRRHGVRVVERPFADDFSAQRNAGIVACQTQWVVEIDADETLSIPLGRGLRLICENADRDGVDCIGVPRLNFLDGTLVAGPGTSGLDYQYRIHKSSGRWRNRVHEEMSFTARVELRLQDGHFMLHMKDKIRHDVRNIYYRSLM